MKGDQKGAKDSVPAFLKYFGLAMILIFVLWIIGKGLLILLRAL